jgi:hypothetical protein
MRLYMNYNRLEDAAKLAIEYLKWVRHISKFSNAHLTPITSLEKFNSSKWNHPNPLFKMDPLHSH